jgi:hypothetical protein
MKFNCKLESKEKLFTNLLQKQLTATSLEQFAFATDRPMQLTTIPPIKNQQIKKKKWPENSPHEEYPLKLGKLAVFVGVAVMLEFPLAVEVVVADALGNVEGGIALGVFCACTSDEKKYSCRHRPMSRVRGIIGAIWLFDFTLCLILKQTAPNSESFPDQPRTW